jgi:hypothetical protein
VAAGTDQTEKEKMKTGTELRDEGMELALWGSGDWQDGFNAAAETLLARNGQLTSADVVAIVGPPPGSSNAIGAAMRSFAVAQKLKPIGYGKATSASRRAGAVAIWGKI